MNEINTFIKMLEHAGIKYEVDQTMDEDGGSHTLEVYVYDGDDSFAVFDFDAYNEPDLKDFRIV